MLKVAPLSRHGQIGEIIELFGTAEKLRTTVAELQTALYAS